MKGMVSIICPTYNCGAFISQTIESVRSQSYKDWELLIIDDCSTDDTVSVVAPYLETDSRIHYLLNEKNSGAAYSRNRGLREARGRWIAFLDSDDLWMPRKLERQVDFMVSKDVHFSYTEYCEIGEDGKETGTMVSGPRRITSRGMMLYCWPGCLTVMYDREYVGLVQIAGIKKNNDYAMWLKVIKFADCYLLGECLAEYRRGRDGSISSHRLVTMIKWHYWLFRIEEHCGRVSSIWHTVINLFFGFFKKLLFVKKYEA